MGCIGVGSMGSGHVRGWLGQEDVQLVAVCDLRPPAVEFLPEGHGHRIHQVGTTGLYDLPEFIGFRLESLCQVIERREQLIMDRNGRADMYTARNHIVAALAHVDVVIGMDVVAEFLGCDMGDHLIRIHVRARPGTGLEYVNGKMSIVLASGNLERCLLYRDRYIALQEPELGVCPRSRPFHKTERRDEMSRHR